MKIKLKSIKKLYYLFTVFSLIGTITLPIQTNAQRRIGIDIRGLSTSEKPIVLSDIKVDIKVVGNIAVTNTEMVFYNPNNRILEGELNFPLADGQVVTGFALDINGKLRDAVAVEKQKATEAFENTIRENIDPSIIEKTLGNNFKTRIYPIPANGSRKILVSYSQKLFLAKNGYELHLPLDYNTTLKNFNLNLAVYENFNSPKIEQSPWGKKLSFEKKSNGFVASYSQTDYKAQGQLILSIPNTTKQQLLIEKGKISGDYYFYSPINFLDNKLKIENKKVNKIAIYWDISASAEKSMKKNIEFLKEYLSQKDQLQIDFYSFNIFLNAKKTFSLKNGNSSELFSYIKSLIYDGGTQLGILNFASLNQDKIDDVLLFSDGISNFGKSDIENSKVSINTIVSGLVSDYNTLKNISYSSGGKFIDLNTETIENAVKKVLSNNIKFLGAEYKTSEIKDFTPNYIKDIYSDEILSISGKLLANTAQIILKFGTSQKVEFTKTILISKNQAQDYDDIVEKFAVTQKIDELDILYDKNVNKIKELGKKFNIVTRETSLIVLDRVEDYVKYNITPPEELIGEYRTIVSKNVKNEGLEKQYYKNYLLELFNDRKKWWEKDFPKDCYVKKDTNSIKHNPRNLHPRDLEQAINASNENIGSINARNENIRFRNASNMNNQNEIVRNKTSEIKLEKWNPDTPYMKILSTKDKNNLYSSYLFIRNGYKESPSFYLDIVELFIEKGLNKEALLVLSNIAELDIENYQLLRILAARLNQIKEYDYSTYALERVLKLRPFEPQSYRDLALVYQEKGEYQKSLDLFAKVIEKKWDNRFPQIELTVMDEINNLIFKSSKTNKKLDLSKIDNQFIKLMPVDIRITLGWDTDNSDMDLWVTDPCGEKAYYANKETHIGGLNSPDYTGGYGPETFMIKNAKKGKYIIQANYYGTSSQSIIGPSTIYLTIYTKYSTNMEKKQLITIRLEGRANVAKIGEIQIN